MNGSTFWKIVLSMLLSIWAVSNIIPVKDTPFEVYAASQVKAEKEAFDALSARVDAAVEAGAYPTYYVALSKIVEKDQIDLSRYYPEIDLSDVKNLDKRNDILLKYLLNKSQGKVKLGLDLKGGVSFTFKVDEGDLSQQETRRTEELEQAKGIIAQRIDGLGVAEPIVRIKGNNRIEVQMPGISTKDNPEAIDSISAPALLEFSMVHRTVKPWTTPSAPAGYTLKVEETINPKTGEIEKRPEYVKKIPLLTGDIIDKAYATQNPYGGYEIILNFTKEGQDKFTKVTGQIAEENEKTNTIGQLAIILDGKLYSAPTVRNEIRGNASISGSFDQREAIELANILNNPLSVGLEVEQVYEVGPTLASGARDASLKAGMIGALLVIVFMTAYYGVFGGIAMLTVFVNVLLVFGSLSYLGSTLSLPGVAALVLTIGMAVDANILILERMREELQAGKSIQTALVNGYDKVFSTIVDANVTTMITAVILIFLGTGPVKGFGVTLAIGIVATVFCALIVNRWLLDLLIGYNFIKKGFYCQMLGRQNLQFLNHAKKAFTCSWCIVLLGVISIIAHRDNLLGIDFKGGDELSISYTSELSIAEIKQAAALDMDSIAHYASEVSASDSELAEAYQLVLSDNGFGEVNAVFPKPIGEGVERLAVQTELGKGVAFYDTLQKIFPDNGLDLLGETTVGSSVGADVTRGAFISIFLSLGGILLYVALRFEFGYGIGAITATVHDILMTIGLYVTLGEFLGIGSGQFTAPMIASILMTVGYSINDTIVVFDRIREELDLNPDMSLKEVVHLAINRTLSRTILTSLTTLLATLALYIWGSGIIVDFSLVFLLGILTGTFSSIFIASPVFYWYHKGDRRKVEEHHVLPTYDWHTDEMDSAQ
ncbi:MAG: protein translocase subunit SecD [Opitutales bacterium]|nr:protein translocase subunit SecD [Opitutales bacterium]